MGLPQQDTSKALQPQVTYNFIILNSIFGFDILPEQSARTISIEDHRTPIDEGVRAWDRHG
jgi:hypothetical protein